MRSRWVILLALVSSATVPAKPSFRYEDLQSLLAKNPQTGVATRSVAELVSALPEELKSNFTFIYKSRSPHGGMGDETKSAVDSLHPRVVLFSRDGRLTLAFTGNPEKPGYDTVEVIHFEDATARFRFNQFILPAAVEKASSLASEAKLNGQTDPASCLRCHGQDPRPISDSYPLWPGFYGSVRDTFPKGSPEFPLYQEFLKKQRNSGVYALLKWPTGTRTPPYLDPAKYDPNASEGSIDKLKFLPNTRLGMAWTELNRKRLERKLKASPEYAKLRYAILSGFLGCRMLPISQEQVEKTYAELLEENQDRLQRLGYHPKGPQKRELDMMEVGFYANEVQLGYLAESLGVDRSDWSLAFEKNSLSFFDGILSSVEDGKDLYLKEDFILEMLRDVASEDAAFKPFFKTYRAYEREAFSERLDLKLAFGACPLLKKREKELKAELPEFHNTALQVSLPATPEILKTAGISGEPFARCVTCHEGAKAIQIGRKISFHSPTALREELKTRATTGKPLHEEILARVSAHGQGQMPPYGEPLADKEVQDLRAYLDAVLAPKTVTTAAN